MVRFLYGFCIDTWPRRKRGHKLKTAIAYCRNNPEWEDYWSSIQGLGDYAQTNENQSARD